MNKVADLISTLTSEEIAKVNKAKWSPREAELVQAMLAATNAGKKATPVTAQSLKISNTYFDKLCSVVLEKLFNLLTPGGFADIFALLQKKALSQVLLHEIGFYHRKMKGEKSAAVKKEFYLVAFETLRRMSFDVLDIKTLRQYANYLKPYLSNKEPFSPAVLEYKFLYVENAFHFLNGDGLKFAPKALANINKVQAYEQLQKDEVALAHYHFCMAGYMKDYADNQNLALEHAHKALDNALKWAGEEDSNFLASAYGMAATILSNRSEFEAALDLYEQAFKRLPAQMQASHYHIVMFACIALVCGKYDLLRAHLDAHMKKFLDSNASLYFRVEAMRLYALLMLYQNQFDEALEFIRELQRVRRKEITDTADIFVRMIDNLYFLLVGDYQQAATQSVKHLKYLKRKNYNYANCDYNHLFYTVGALAKMKLKGKVKVAALEPHLSFSKRGFMKMYGGLLDSVINEA